VGSMIVKGRTLALAIGALSLAGAMSPAQSFWQRSQVSRCSDATSEAERMQLRCWELNAYADPGWPALGVGGAYSVPPYESPGAYERFSPRLKSGPVTRRLG
jgi:hypothetical protein